MASAIPQTTSGSSVAKPPARQSSGMIHVGGGHYVAPTARPSSLVLITVQMPDEAHAFARGYNLAQFASASQWAASSPAQDPASPTRTVVVGVNGMIVTRSGRTHAAESILSWLAGFRFPLSPNYRGGCQLRLNELVSPEDPITLAKILRACHGLRLQGRFEDQHALRRALRSALERRVLTVSELLEAFDQLAGVGHEGYIWIAVERYVDSLTEDEFLSGSPSVPFRERPGLAQIVMTKPWQRLWPQRSGNGQQRWITTS